MKLLFYLKLIIVTSVVQELSIKETWILKTTSQINIIESYFNGGYQYTELVGLLEKYHGVTITLSTLKRKLREYSLRRRGNNYDEVTVRELITRGRNDAGRLGGYRYMWYALRLRHHINIPRQVAATIMKEIDPDSVRERRARRLTRRYFKFFGPNFTWHIDGKRYILELI